MEHNFPNTFFKHSNGVSTHATIIRFDKKLQKVQSDVTQNLNPKLDMASTKKNGHVEHRASETLESCLQTHT